MVMHVSASDFEEEVLKEKGVVVVDFWATWCGPCKMQSPVIEELSEEMSDVEFFKVDVDENKETAQEFGIMSIPTLLIKKDGEVVDKLVGFHSKDQLAEVLNKNK